MKKKKTDTKTELNRFSGSLFWPRVNEDENIKCKLIVIIGSDALSMCRRLLHFEDEFSTDDGYLMLKCLRNMGSSYKSLPMNSLRVIVRDVSLANSLRIP